MSTQTLAFRQADPAEGLLVTFRGVQLKVRVKLCGRRDVKDCISNRCHPNGSDRFREIRGIRGSFLLAANSTAQPSRNQ